MMTTIMLSQLMIVIEVYHNGVLRCEYLDSSYLRGISLHTARNQWFLELSYHQMITSGISCLSSWYVKGYI